MWTEGMVREFRLADFFTLPDRDLQRENELKPYEILTAVRLPAAWEDERVLA